jgi:Spy/CpxP family protein refolding chaperone
VTGTVESLGRVRAQALVLLALAFLAGAFAGGAIERVSRARLRADRGSRAAGYGGMSRGYGGRGGGFTGIADSLNLSAGQRAKIDSIMARARPRSDSLRHAMSAASDDTRKQVEAVFTPAQRAKADSMRARIDSMMHTHGDSLRPGGMRGGYGPPGGRSGGQRP